MSQRSIFNCLSKSVYVFLICKHLEDFSLFIVSGTDCDTDINECQEPNKCGDELKVCANNVGSYTCTCMSGYTLSDNGTCVGRFIIAPDINRV